MPAIFHSPMKAIILTILSASLTAMAAPVISVSQSPGGPVTAGSTINAGPAIIGGVTEPKRVNDPQGPVVVTFAGVPPGIYLPQRSIDGFNNWSGIDQPATPDVGGNVQFEDFYDGPVIFYRLLKMDPTCLTFTITNTGDQPITGLEALQTGTGSAVENFTVDSSGFPGDGTLAVNQSTQLTVCFQPFEVGPITITVSITGNGVPSFNFDVSGTGVFVDPGGDPPPPEPPPGFVLYDAAFVPATPTTPAYASGKIAGGPSFGEIYLEHTTDLSVPGSWQFLDFLSLDSNGRAVFGLPTPLTLPGTAGAKKCFLRAAIVEP